MKRMLLIAALAAGVCASAQQLSGDFGGYSAMQIDAGRFLGSFDGPMVIKEMTDGVRIVLLSDDPDVKPLPIRAYTMQFDYKDQSATPSRIIMEGNVEVQHPQGTVTAERADWDFEKELLTFSGNPVMNSESIRGLRGSRILINFKTNTLEVVDMQAQQVPLRGVGEADPSLFTDEDFPDWPGFVQTLKTQAAKDEPSPGKQILAHLGADVSGQLAGTPLEVLIERKSSLINQLNKVIKKPGLYNETAWKNVTLSDEVKALMAKTAPEAAEQTRLNRLLLEAAYPEYIVKH